MSLTNATTTSLAANWARARACRAEVARRLDVRHKGLVDGRARHAELEGRVHDGRRGRLRVRGQGAGWVADGRQ